MNRGKSFMYDRNSVGPDTDPSGTPGIIIIINPK